MTQDKRALRAIAADGRSSACSLGCKTTAGWSHDGNITSKSSSPSPSSPACSCYSDIYEMASSVDELTVAADNNVEVGGACGVRTKDSACDRSECAIEPIEKLATVAVAELST